MTPPKSDDQHYRNERDEHFRFDNEFVALIKTQSEQKIQLDNLQEKIVDVKDFNAKNFDNINRNLENLTTSIQSIQKNCISHQIMEREKNKQPENKDIGSFLLSVNPIVFKVLAFIIAMIIGYLLNIPMKPTP